MKVETLYFGVLKDALGTGRSQLELSEAATVGELLDQLKIRHAIDPVLWGSLAVAVNREYVTPSTVLSHGDEVALLPPVSGGLDVHPR